jgi:hypothetical protein
MNEHAFDLGGLVGRPPIQPKSDRIVGSVRRASGPGITAERSPVANRIIG